MMGPLLSSLYPENKKANVTCCRLVCSLGYCSGHCVLFCIKEGFNSDIVLPLFSSQEGSVSSLFPSLLSGKNCLITVRGSPVAWRLVKQLCNWMRMRNVLSFLSINCSGGSPKNTWKIRLVLFEDLLFSTSLTKSQNQQWLYTGNRFCQCSLV